MLIHIILILAVIAFLILVAPTAARWAWATFADALAPEEVEEDPEPWAIVDLATESIVERYSHEAYARFHRRPEVEVVLYMPRTLADSMAAHPAGKGRA